MLITILATVVVLGVLIFVHELGHFMTAKWVDIEVPRFSIGLGPKMVGFRRGETEYVISWLPLGGYVKMAGMEEFESIEGGGDERRDRTGLGAPTDAGLLTEVPSGPTRSRDFESKSIPARALVLSAGVLMNFLFAFVVFALSSFVWGVRAAPEPTIAEVRTEMVPEGAEALASVPVGATVVAVDDEEIEDWDDFERAMAMATPGPVTLRFADAAPVTFELPEDDSLRAAAILSLVPTLPPVVGAVQEGTPASEAGLEAGDRIVRAAGQPIESWNALQTAVEAHPNRPLALVVERGGDRLEVTLTPEIPAEAEEGAEAGPRIGVASGVERERLGAFEAVAHGAEETWYWIETTAGFLGQLFTGEQSPRNLGGPILIGQVSGKVARAGIEAFLNFMAVFSINLAVLNLLPIPILDGGQLVFLGVEAVRGRALSIEQRMRLSQIGFVIVLAIMVWALANDVLRLFGI